MRKIEVPGFVKGLIFDCDGTLVDSMPLHMRAWEHAIRSKGTPWDLEFFLSKKGMPEENIVALYNTEFALALDPADTVKMKHEFFRAHADEFKPISHVMDIVLKHRGVLPMAIASGGTKENVNLELDALRIRDLFKIILTADDEVKPKPAPDIFLEAARRMSVEPGRCQVFEDGDLGLEAARMAGMLPTDIRQFE
jgi:beta-phosphoglucomutase-like phosphatase (HAD superfamily)